MSAYTISIVSIIGINVILAVSLNMISGFCGQISLGHGAFFGAGAYAAALVMVKTANVPLALLTALIAGSMLGIIVGFASLRVRSDFLAVTTIGVNAYLWRATLDTLSFMPLLQTDSNGGVIVTDWYVNPRSPGERMKLLEEMKSGDVVCLAAGETLPIDGGLTMRIC